MKIAIVITTLIVAYLIYYYSKKRQPVPSAAASEKRVFLTVVKEYIDKYLLENPLKQETQDRYDVYYRNFCLFLAATGNTNIALEDFKIKHTEQFRTWLRINLKTCSLRHASRQVELLKRVTKYSQIMGYMINDYLEPVKAQRDRPKKIIYLDSQEIKKLMVYRFHSDIMRIATDLFLFQCFTGLSYADIYKYEITEKNGKLWVEGDRQKSGEEYKAFFFDEARDIYIKYEGKIPRLSNQKYNMYLKEVAGLLNIRKKLTTHVGRKTHATLLSERGMTTKSISMVLGNTERVCGESYIAKTYEIIENEMERVGLGTTLLKSAS